MMKRNILLTGLMLLVTLVANAQSFDVDLSRQPQGQPFRYSVKVPDGNYRVSVTIGSRKKAGETAVRAESRRLFFEPQPTKKGQTKTLTFVVNKRSPYIYPTEEVNSQSGNGQSPCDSIRIKDRERYYVNWDDSLTLEFCGACPLVSRVLIERDTTATTLYLCGNSTVVDQEYEPWASWGQMIPRWFDAEVSVANYAESGLTANSFLAQRRFDKILSTIRKGDYVVCEFGHNDQKERSAGAGAYYNFAYALKRFIDGVRQKQATILFCTPTQRRAFDNSGQHIVETDLTVSDLNASSVQAVEALISKLTAARIDVDELFARQATIQRLTTGTIAAALGESLNLASNQSVVTTVSSQVQTRMAEAAPAVVKIDSSRGTAFKSNTMSTELRARVYWNGECIENRTRLREVFGSGAYLQWEWRRTEDSGWSTLLATDSHISDDGFVFSVTPADVDAAITFRCSLITD